MAGISHELWACPRNWIPSWSPSPSPCSGNLPRTPLLLIFSAQVPAGRFRRVPPTNPDFWTWSAAARSRRAASPVTAAQVRASLASSHRIVHMFEWGGADSRRLRPLQAALPRRRTSNGRGDAGPLSGGSPDGREHRADRQPSLYQVHRVEPSNVAVPAMRCMLGLAGLHRATRVAGMARSLTLRVPAGELGLGFRRVRAL